MTILDLLGTFVFGVTGALIGIEAALDVVGIMVAATATALAGGIVRDVLIGVGRPDAIRDWRYTATALVAGVATILGRRLLPRVRVAVAVLDAAGVALFSVSGADTSLAWHVSLFLVPLLGVVTATGGSVVRDLLVARVPVVLRAEVYALAGLVGGVTVVLVHLLSAPVEVGAVTGAILCFGLRLVSLRRGWSLPRWESV